MNPIIRALHPFSHESGQWGQGQVELWRKKKFNFGARKIQKVFIFFVTVCVYVSATPKALGALGHGDLRKFFLTNISIRLFVKKYFVMELDLFRLKIILKKWWTTRKSKIHSFGLEVNPYYNYNIK